MVKGYNQNNFWTEKLISYNSTNFNSHTAFDMKVLQIRPSPAQSAELARLDELNRKTQRECAHFTF